MSYKNYLDHQTYGRLWYVITLRNWCVMFSSLEKNLEAGPCCELILLDHPIVSAGDSPQRAVENLVKTLDAYKNRYPNKPLRVNFKKKNFLKQLWKDFRMRRLYRRFKKDGIVNPITGEEGISI